MDRFTIYNVIRSKKYTRLLLETVKKINDKKCGWEFSLLTKTKYNIPKKYMQHFSYIYSYACILLEGFGTSYVMAIDLCACQLDC